MTQRYRLYQEDGKYYVLDWKNACYEVDNKISDAIKKVMEYGISY